jgi:L-rhamnose-H+ transport protein
MFWIMIVAFAGICTGSFGLPMKFTSKWQWEHTWSMFAFWGLLVAPWVISAATVPDLMAIYSNARWGTLAMVCAYGLCWGLGSITFGMGLAYMGLALGYSLMIGLIIVVGSVGPLLTANKTFVADAKSTAIITGVAIILGSLVVNALAAIRKEKELTAKNGCAQGEGQRSFFKGLMLCLITGLAAPGLNYAYIKGDILTNAAISAGASVTVAANAVLPIALSGAGVLNLLFCAHLVHKKSNWKSYFAKGTGRYYVYSLGMAVWTVGVALFGVASANLGDKGHSIGWAVINSVSIFCANMLGILSGEWRGTSAKTMTIMVVGLCILLAGICFIGYANSLK